MHVTWAARDCHHASSRSRLGFFASSRHRDRFITSSQDRARLASSLAARFGSAQRSGGLRWVFKVRLRGFA
eukprot:667145-Rhodomonas_salina.1